MIVSTPDLAVAKAALTAALLRSDPTPMARGPIEAGIEHIDRTLDKCSNPNVQECKNWIATNVVHSHGRTTALGKFLVALSESMEEDFDRPSVRKRRLHVLYIVSDVLHHVVVRQGNLGFGALWAVHLPDMVTAASFFDKSPKHIARVRDLLSIWEERKYIPTALLERLKECVTLASDKHSGYPIFPKEDDAATGAAKPPFTTPYIHGDPSLPWHEQPASCWLPLLKKGRGKPMRPEDVRPVTIHAGPNDDELDKVVDEVIALRHELWRPKPVAELADYDMNAMGQLIKPGVPEEKQVNYYGWTLAEPIACAFSQETSSLVALDEPQQQPTPISGSKPSRTTDTSKTGDEEPAAVVAVAAVVIGAVAEAVTIIDAMVLARSRRLAWTQKLFRHVMTPQHHIGKEN
ncbi:uricase [Purpureocillium lavendulum]|uniref:Uricase n=1 Tax=Purpureocillium lavendulum TaxID=1247861 RepID=A0AB34FM84_9HYPO|nr:uricase [Purpureocillium lavendulum]